MTPGRKVGLVALGYVAAVVVACAAVGLRVATTQGPDAQAASGMYAFGDAVLFVVVLGVAALLPTGAALVFLRPYRPFWSALSTLGLVVAVTGLAAVALFIMGRHAAAPSPLATWAGLSVLRILVAPLLVLASLLCTVVTPYRVPRLAFLAATVTEMAVSAYGGLTWFLPLLFPGR